MRVAVVGVGYVGLVSGACLADFGHIVTCVDKDTHKIARLNNAEMPIYEPGLDGLVERNTREGRLFFTDDTASAVAAADVVLLAVGTPARRGDGFADVSFVMEAAREAAAAMQGYTVLVTKSTVPIGTSDEVEAVVGKQCPDADFAVVSNPEFLREGAAIEDFKHPDRIVVGTEDERARVVMRELYRALFINETPILFTGRRTAELIKYASNAFLATKITFINEMAELCEKVGADVQQVARGMGLDRRIGSKFLHAGPGYGGSCFPKDASALIALGERYGARSTIVETVVAANEVRKRAMAEKVITACGGLVRGKKVAVLGLTFKPNTDDMREAPSLAIVPPLIEMGAELTAYDPAGMLEAGPLMPSVEMASDPYACMEGADVAVIITEWDQFRALDLDRMKRVMRTPTLVDLRNIYDPAEMAARGFVYVSVGRP
jgi:UDPglucose 6-dehydrogenase